VVDADAHWAGGRTHLVQTGDVVDRGPESRRALDLLMRLEREARRAGGRVHALLGNHEVMVMLGDLRYTSAEEIQAFAPAARAHSSQAVSSARTLLETAVPAGQAELREAFGPDGHYGKWLRGHDAIVNIDGALFVHGGISRSVAAIGCPGINHQIRRELTAGFAELSQQPLASAAARPDGPLWFRGLAQEDEATFGQDIDTVLETMRAHHCCRPHDSSSGRVTPRFRRTSHSDRYRNARQLLSTRTRLSARNSPGVFVPRTPLRRHSRGPCAPHRPGERARGAPKGRNVDGDL
jgi:hypothetical protein